MIDYDQILPELFVGSCPGQPDDAAALRRAGVTAVLCLQTDDDFRQERIDWTRLEAAYRREGIEVRRVPVRDFDAADLEDKLLDCVAALEALTAAGHRVYLHCTAGAGRSPSVAIAFLAHRRRWRLEEAIEYVRNHRDCTPNVEAIRRGLAGPGW